ncbi:hypothetical protein LCGC14_0654170 [marine sediment metagenome]|uniref:Uncharacterized protein n=1 Tax=marine sediment metagenome TaxID=412755 RepID=A0A0F9QVH4_9ZZZZ
MTGKHWEILRASERGPVNVNSVDSYDESRVRSEALHPGPSDYLKALDDRHKKPGCLKPSQ